MLEGNFGLEKESLRVLEDGTLSHTSHPFPNDAHIVKDFCENQTEINTSVHTSIEETVKELGYHTERIYNKLRSLAVPEYLWPFSNPPHIENEEDIPVAVFEGQEVSKSRYREYLSDKYGRYKMTFSGIHVNFSFSEDLLKADFALSGEQEYRVYKDQLYLDLAKRMAEYGWLLVAITAASPVMDSSFVEKGVYGGDVFTGMASVRCSEMGYWNEFTPILSYENIEAYADSIQKYVDLGLLKAPSELYYPIRLKPAGRNNLESLRKNGIDHIELRMFDLNPLAAEGVEERDIRFAQLLMVWLASTPGRSFDKKDQVQAVQNFKNAARYDLKTVKISVPDKGNCSVVQAAMETIDEMREFYREVSLDVSDILDYQYSKFTDAENRYAWQIRNKFQGGYVKKTLALVKQIQERNKCVNCLESMP